MTAYSHLKQISRTSYQYLENLLLLTSCQTLFIKRFSWNQKQKMVYTMLTPFVHGCVGSSSFPGFLCPCSWSANSAASNITGAVVVCLIVLSESLLQPASYVLSSSQTSCNQRYLPWFWSEPGRLYLIWSRDKNVTSSRRPRAGQWGHLWHGATLGLIFQLIR